MEPKLDEMGAVLETIVDRLGSRDSNSLVIVLGDHGMSDAGSHGGASVAEVMTPIVVIDPTTNGKI